MLAMLDVVENARAREQKALFLAAAFQLLGGQLLSRNRAVIGVKGFDLAFDRLTFPTPCHTFIVGLRRRRRGAGSVLSGPGFSRD